MTQIDQLARALAAPNGSVRLRAALAAGTTPDTALIPTLVARCGVEADFFVRDMLTWALIRHDHAAVLRLVLPELRSTNAQARAQAVHTVSKIGDPATWPHLTGDLLTDEDDEVARAAWRTAVGLVPAAEAPQLARTLASQFGRGDRDVQLSLARALAGLGDAATPAIERAKSSRDDGVRLHALATERIVADPDAGFDAAIAEARRAVALRNAPGV